MLERKDILSLPYLKKADFTGSSQGMRFRFHLGQKALPPKEGEEGETAPALEVSAWEGPYCYDVTPKEAMKQLEAEFSEEGIRQAIRWLNQLGKDAKKGTPGRSC